MNDMWTTFEFSNTDDVDMLTCPICNWHGAVDDMSYEVGAGVNYCPHCGKQLPEYVPRRR